MIDIPIVTSYNGKGVKTATKDLGLVERAAVSMTSRLGAAVGGVALLSGAFMFAKSSIKAFAEDQKQVASLNQILKNDGFSALAGDVGDYISQIQMATGVSDSELRPALQNLLVATGSLSMAQKGLNLALDVAAGTGKDIYTVTTALSRAYLGSTTALSKLGGGLDKVTLKAGNMEQINAALEKQFAGSSAAAAATFSGQMSILNEHLGEAKELIGKSLVDALSNAAGPDGIGGMTSAIDELSAGVGSLIDRLSTNVSNNSWLSKLLQIKNIPIIGGWYEGLRGMGKEAIAKSNAPAMHGGAAGYGGRISAYNADKAAQDKFAKEQAVKAAALKAAEAKKAQQEKEKILLGKAHLAIQKLSNQFDTKRIELNAVLLSDATQAQKDSAKAQIALLDAQDKMTLNTTAGASSALALANAQLALLTNHQKLADSETALLLSTTKVTGSQDALTASQIKALVAQSSLAIANANLYDSHDSLRKAADNAAGSLNALAGKSNSQLSGYQDYRTGERGAPLSSIPLTPMPQLPQNVSPTGTGGGSVISMPSTTAPAINLTVNGALDAESTARQIVTILNNSFYRGTGGAGGLLTS